MDGRGGCCIARYAGGGGYEDAKKMERVMLKFRPIAPKPATGGSVFGSSSSDNNNSNKTSSGETTTYVKAGRGKRKYNASGARRACGGGRKRVRASPEENDSKRLVDIETSRDTTTVVTLPLLPESPTEIKTPTSRYVPPAPIWLSFNSPTTTTAVPGNNNSVARMNAISHHSYQNHQVAAGGVKVLGVVGSGVTVECVTEMWVSGEGLGRTDEERVRILNHDTCPGFISDAQNRVTWTNRAYRKMVVGEEEGGDVVVWLAMKERVPVSYPAFTCRVRVQNTCTKEIKILPCDVWRMDGGGFAWRLDVKAALSLGR
uniref:DUF7950 domain-containing protein n=1 Tax=Kalanchoe fedtschenkoi TaxID=63787 RepID=A0A7N0VDS6_KALFE